MVSEGMIIGTYYIIIKMDTASLSQKQINEVDANEHDFNSGHILAMTICIFSESM